MQWFLSTICRIVQSSPQSNSRTLPHFKRKPQTLNHKPPALLSCPSPAPGNCGELGTPSRTSRGKPCSALTADIFCQFEFIVSHIFWFLKEMPDINILSTISWFLSVGLVMCFKHTVRMHVHQIWFTPTKLAMSAPHRWVLSPCFSPTCLSTCPLFWITRTVSLT